MSLALICSGEFRDALRDCSIHIESACQLHGTKMTPHRLILKDLIIAYQAERLYIKNLRP